MARDLLERALPPDAGGSAAGPLLALLVDVHLAEGRVADAQVVADRLARLAVDHPSHYLRATAALSRGKVCVASEDGAARGCLHDALSLFSLAQMPVELARARLELAKALASDRPQVAINEATSALAAFERLQAARDADAAAALLRSWGASGRTGAKTREPLSNREREVLELLGHGLSNPEIATRLFISRKTVEHHVSRILAKLHLRSRAEAAVHAVRSAPPRGEGVSR
jgi:DNA-binding CsgD family transcriptional regulator